MKLIAVAALVVVALASAQAADVVAPVFKILRSEFDQDPAGAYKYGFETENGIVRDEAGELKTVTDEEGKPQEVVVVRGTYSYTDPEGKLITVNYVADETGFHPEGDHIPKPDARR